MGRTLDGLSRSADSRRDDRRRLGRRALSRRHRRPGRPHRGDRTHPVGGRAHHRCRRADRLAGIHRRSHPHGRPGGVGPDRELLLLAWRHHRDHGQLWIRAGAMPPRRPRVVRPLPHRGRRHPDRGHAGWHRLDLGNFPGIPGERRPPAEGDQLRRVPRAFRASHVRDGQARADREGDRRRPDADGRRGEGGRACRRHGLLELARDDSRHARRHARGESHRRLVGARSPGGRSRGSERGRLPDRTRHLRRRGTASIPHEAQAARGGVRAPDHVRRPVEPPGRQAQSVDLSARLSRRVRRGRRPHVVRARRARSTPSSR